LEQLISTLEAENLAAASPGTSAPVRRIWPMVLYGAVAAGLIAVGAVVRLRVYLADLSLWRDEAALTLNIIQKSFRQLFGPLDYDQGAPVGFLMIQKAVVTLRGDGEMALRFWPVTASILAIPIFFAVCYRIVGARAAIFALAFFALATDRMDYWADNKQYSTDCLTTVFLLLMAGRAMTAGEEFVSMRRLRWLAMAGAIAIWFSHPSIFMLAGIFCALAVRWIGQRPREKLWGLLLLAGAWGASFLMDYFLCLSKLTKSSYLQHYWSAVAGAFAPAPVSMAGLIWYKRSFLELFNNFSIEFEGLAGVMFLLGLYELYRRGRHWPVLLGTPIVAALAASALHQYPFDWRLLIFALPLTTMTVAAGLDFFKGQARLVQVAALGMLLISPVSKTLGALKRPQADCNMRGAVAFIAEHKQSGDLVYLFQSARYDYLYYQPRYGLTDLKYVVSPERSSSVSEWANELSQFRTGRLWILEEDPFVADVERESDFQAQQPLVANFLDATGRTLWKHRTFNEFVACYDLRPEARLSDAFEAADHDAPAK
jgi:hypothetical protein